MKPETLEKIKTAIQGQLMTAEVLELSTRLDEDLGFDSLDYIELSFALEDEFTHVRITEGEIMNCVTVQDVVTLMETKFPELAE